MLEDRPLARRSFLAAAALCAAQALWEHRLLPPVVASHFGPSGLPNGWMPRAAYTGVTLAATALLVAALSAGAASLAETDDARINLPHKAYWLAPERRAATLDAVAAWLYWFGAGTCLLLLDVFRQAFRVNRGLAPCLEHPVQSLVVYVAFAVLWTARLLARFARVP